MPSQAGHTIGAIVEHKYEAHCGCGASWWLFAEPEPEDIECTACGATVVEYRDLGEVHP